MRFEDDGVPYDPTKDVPVDVDYDPDSQMGGLGKLIAFTIADSVVYEYTDDKNVCRFKGKQVYFEERPVIEHIKSNFFCNNFRKFNIPHISAI